MRLEALCLYHPVRVRQDARRKKCAQVQSSIDDAQPGDTIQLEAGKTFPITDVYGLMLKYKTGSTGDWITITTTEADKLPANRGRA